MIYRGYLAFKHKKDALLECPHCYQKQEDTVADHCIIGRPDRSKSECIHCYGVFGVVSLDGDLHVVKLHSLNDNIN